MRVLLTGATGFVGSHVLARLLRDGDHSVAVVLRAASARWRIADLLGRVHVIEGDLARASELAEPVGRFSPEAVLHLAWGHVADREQSPLLQVDNVRDTVQLVTLAHSAGARHFLGAGSQAEYGPCPHGIDEGQPTRPSTPYGIAKLCAGLLAEQMCRALDMRYAWFRIFSAYGPMDLPTTMISRVGRALLSGERPATTRGDQLWDYLYVADAAEAIHGVLEEPAARGVFNLGSGRVQTIRSVIERLRDLIRPGAELGLGELAYGPDQLMHLEANVERVRRTIGWEAVTDLDTGLSNTVAWLRRVQGS
ncbi:MAG: NAD(P)-dependent oxidoreductase [Polyangiaceae bacterium]|nr:NAD(P)-dependent oxidoreductase [Polyangiaceae bacterium]